MEKMYENNRDRRGNRRRDAAGDRPSNKPAVVSTAGEIVELIDEVLASEMPRLEDLQHFAETPTFVYFQWG